LVTQTRLNFTENREKIVHEHARSGWI
jgi:hypothetical protein